MRSLLSTWKVHLSDLKYILRPIMVIHLIQQAKYNILEIPSSFVLTDSSRDDVTAASITPPALILARTGAPKPIDESCRLVEHKQIPLLTSPSSDQVTK